MLKAKNSILQLIQTAISDGIDGMDKDIASACQ